MNPPIPRSWRIVAGLVVIIAVAFVLSGGDCFHSAVSQVSVKWYGVAGTDYAIQFNTGTIVRGRNRVVDYSAAGYQIAATVVSLFKEWSEDIRTRYFNNPKDLLM